MWLRASASAIAPMIWFGMKCMTMPSAIAREKQLKAGSRQRKIDLIIAMNPQWRDLYAEIVG
jgi:putative endonuclease